MVIDPIRAWKRWRSFQAEVADEVNFLIERHGALAQKAAKEQLERGRIAPGRRKVLEAAARRLAS